MPTLDDLRATLHERADLCDDSVLTGLVTTDRARPVQRRRLLTPLLAAAAVLVAVGGAAGLGTALHHGGTATPAAAGPEPTPPTWQFHIADVPGWTVSYDFANWTDGSDGMPGAWQEAATFTPAKGQAKVVYTYEPTVGAGYPGNAMGGNVMDGRAVAVTINGQPGWWAPGGTVNTKSLVPSVAADPWAAVNATGDGQPQLVWKNPDGKSWNMLMGTVGYRPKTYSFDNAVARKAMIRMAEAVSLTSSGGSVTLPFAAHLSARYRLTDTRSSTGGACGEWVVDPSRDGLMICRVTPDQQHNAHLGLAGGADQTVAHRDLSDGTVLVVVLYDDARHELTPADVLDSVDVTPTLADRSTWLPAGS